MGDISILWDLGVLTFVCWSLFTSIPPGFYSIEDCLKESNKGQKVSALLLLNWIEKYGSATCLLPQA